MQLVRRELNLLKSTLQLLKTNGEFWSDKWKKFKKDYHITSATMQVLLEAPGEEFFSSTKQTCNKNKTIEQLSPYAKEFFRIFLK
jgi:hypothetical protein